MCVCVCVWGGGGGGGGWGSKAYLKWHIRHSFGQIVGFEAVPVVQMFPDEDLLFQWNC